MNLKKVIGWGVAALVVIGVIGYNAYQEKQSQQSSGKKNVYAVLPLTGNLSAQGQEEKKTLEVFQEYYTNLPFKIKFYDNKSSPLEGLNIAQQIALNDENPIFISGVGSLSRPIITQLKQMNGFMILAPSTQTETGEYKEFQRVSFNTADMNKPFIDLIKPDATVVIVYGNNEASALGADKIKVAIEQKGGKVLSKMAFEHDQLDTRILALKAIEYNPDIILVAGAATPGFINIIKSLNEQEFKGMILAEPSLRTPSVIAQFGSKADGIYVPIMPTERIYKEYPQVAKALEDNGLELYNFPIVMWDVGKIVSYFIKNDIPFKQEEFRKMGKWHGISGDIEFTENGNSSYPFVLSVIKDGKFIPVE